MELSWEARSEVFSVTKLPVNYMSASRQRLMRKEKESKKRRKRTNVSRLKAESKKS